MSKFILCIIGNELITLKDIYFFKFRLLFLEGLLPVKRVREVVSEREGNNINVCQGDTPKSC